MKTLREKYIAALLARGEREVKQTHKYTVFSRSFGGYYYIGKSGGIRFGFTLAGSVPINDKLKKHLLEEADLTT